MEKERRIAIKILEKLAEKAGDEDIFDTDWHELENLVTEIIKEQD